MRTKWVTTWKAPRYLTQGKNYIHFARLFKKLFKLELIVPDCLNEDTCYKIIECLTNGFNKALLVTSIVRTF